MRLEFRDAMRSLCGIIWGLEGALGKRFLFRDAARSSTLLTEKFMTENNIRQKILERLEPLSGEKVKHLLSEWLVSSSDHLEDFEELLRNESSPRTEELLDYGEIDSTLNFRSLTEAEMVRQSQLALEAYRRQGVSVPHDRVREWADRLGTDREGPCPR